MTAAPPDGQPGPVSGPAALLLRPAGRAACLIEAPAELAASLAEHLRAARLPGVVDVVPGARTVLLDGSSLDRLLPALRPILQSWQRPTPGPVAAAETVEIPVIYDGPDLAEVAREAGLDVPTVIDLHTRTPMRVAFCGFAPGFAYIDELPPPLRMPRLPNPRTEVPAGSVAIAEQYTGVYPQPSPGGWRLLGRTTAELWNLERPQPSLLRPGLHVRFTAVR
ncbi:MAG TPA: allophanate hydrolase subunit 1 [Actinoplanes sp.]|nr:allophanate hydrolase subunit 1 [Actinoplanes sp.]